MKTRSFFEDHEIETMCIEELKKGDFLPNEPSPVRIERFIEDRFGSDIIRYEELEDGLLGFTIFTPLGVEAIVVSRILDEDGSLVSARRGRTTLAHEAGHALLHAASFIGKKTGKTKLQVLCRDVLGSQEREYSTYSGDWMEYQANRAMGSLLLPEPLFRQAAAPFVTTDGFLGEGKVSITPQGRIDIEHTLSETFNVNPIVVRHRLKHVFEL